MLQERLESVLAIRRAFTSAEFRGHLTEYFLPVRGLGPMPQARLAEQLAHSTLTSTAGSSFGW